MSSDQIQGENIHFVLYFDNPLPSDDETIHSFFSELIERLQTWSGRYTVQELLLARIDDQRTEGVSLWTGKVCKNKKMLEDISIRGITATIILLPCRYPRVPQQMEKFAESFSTYQRYTVTYIAKRWILGEYKPSLAQAVMEEPDYDKQKDIIKDTLGRDGALK